MPSNKQRRQAAQRRLQRQLERRAELARKRRRNVLIGVTAVAVLLVLGAVWLITGITGDDPADQDTAAAPTSAGAPVVDGSDGTCDFTPDSSGNPNLTDVGTPPPEVTPTGTAALTMTTNLGPIGLSLDRAGAPCAAASFVYLTEQGFFDGTVCHRETDSEGLKVLQCGDPSATGSGGPTYEFPTQVTGDETYPRGTLAMANSGQGTDGSQFFLVYGDSQLSPDYTVVGTIDEAGLATLDTIAANGNDASNGPGDGAPTQEVRIESMTVAA
ncbi:peptidylprolyl isomerase [Geodermatophilus sp. CPCC 206100]|uniref:peptidylprolyl isomerase n=1 Tax=Geodermatophilus sp. CPCC 206100 TaxID=3020054 RepID=UPI003AFFB5EE